MTAAGIIKDIAEVGGYPTLTFKPSEVAVDTDGDGMPDAWGLKHRLNPKKLKMGLWIPTEMAILTWSSVKRN